MPTGSSGAYGIRVEGVDDVMLRLAKCCRPVPGDPIVGYISLGRGITIHRDDCPNVAALRKDPERFVAGRTGRASTRTPSRSRSRSTPGTATACSRTSRARFAEAGINIVEARCIVTRPMVSNRFVVEVGDTQVLKATVTRLRNVDGVFDAYRVTPSAVGLARRPSARPAARRRPPRGSGGERVAVDLHRDRARRRRGGR